MLRTKGIAHFTLPVSDLARSVAFYTEVVGLELVRKNPHLAFLRTGKDYLVLALTEVPPAPEHPSESSRNVHQAFIVESRDFEESLAELRAAGVPAFYQDERGPGSTFAGRSAYFRDPDGNILEIIDLEATAFRVGG
jgi:catechol 2,3-dioxygenase-like lactoylglutathione lyase family enzyme